MAESSSLKVKGVQSWHRPCSAADFPAMVSIIMPGSKGGTHITHCRVCQQTSLTSEKQAVQQAYSSAKCINMAAWVCAKSKLHGAIGVLNKHFLAVWERVFSTPRPQLRMCMHLSYRYPFIIQVRHLILSLVIRPVFSQPNGTWSSNELRALKIAANGISDNHGHRVWVLPLRSSAMHSDYIHIRKYSVPH